MMREAFPTPLVVHSPSLSRSLAHLLTSSSRNNRPSLPSPQPTSSSLWPFSISPSSHLSLPFFPYLFILPPFLCPLPFPSPFPSRSPLLPFSLFPSLPLAIPVTSPNPFVFPSRGRESKRIVGGEGGDGRSRKERERDKEHEGSSKNRQSLVRCWRLETPVALKNGDVP